MGFLKWWRGVWAEAKASPAPAASESTGEFVRVSSNGRVSVVGESHYQPALRAAVGGRVCNGGFEDAIDVQALLVPEPNNRFDKWAVRVDAHTPMGAKTVGYLAADLCHGYHVALRDGIPLGSTAWCPGKIMGGGSRSYGIHLHLAEPAGLIIRSKEPENAWLLSPDRQVVVTGEEHHQDVLDPLAPPHGGIRRVFAELGWCTATTGKHAGKRLVEVRIDGRRVGQLTPAMTDRYESLIGAVERSGQIAACEALIETTDKGLQVSLALPKLQSGPAG